MQIYIDEIILDKKMRAIKTHESNYSNSFNQTGDQHTATHAYVINVM